MLVNTLPTTMLKPYAKSRVNNHVQTIAFIQLVHRGDFDKAIDIGLCENVVTTRTRNDKRVWSTHADAAYADFDAAKKAFLNQISEAEKRNFISLTSTGIFLPMNNTDLKHFRSNQHISRSAMEYGTALFDEIARWYTDEQVKAGTTPTTPAAPPTTPPPSPPASLPPTAGSPATSAAAGDEFAKSLLELGATLAKVTSPDPSGS